VDAIQELAEALRTARYAVVLTGAGASTESGLPDFRSKTGLWRDVDPTRILSMSALRRSPVPFYQFYRKRLLQLRGAQPNPVHIGLAALQKAGYIKSLITPTIDGLHQAAGSTDVIEMHGCLRECVCLACDRRYPSDLIDVEVETEADIPRCPSCGGMLKPAVVLFEEALPEEAVSRALEATHQADLFIVIGSSLEVGPVNQLPMLAVQGGADLAIINLDPTFLDHRARWVIRQKAGGVVTELCRHLDLECGEAPA